jgi:hypothetical protein
VEDSPVESSPTPIVEDPLVESSPAPLVEEPPASVPVLEPIQPIESDPPIEDLKQVEMSAEYYGEQIVIMDPGPH